MRTAGVGAGSGFLRKGVAGNRPIWPTHASRSKSNDALWLVGVDSAKDALYARLRIAEPVPGYIHFPTEDGFGPDYFEQLTSERREMRKRMGQPYTVWVLPEGKRNEVLDTFVGALAVRRSLPRRIEAGLEYVVDPPAPEPEPEEPRTSPSNSPVGRRLFRFGRPLGVLSDPYL